MMASEVLSIVAADDRALGQDGNIREGKRGGQWN